MEPPEYDKTIRLASGDVGKVVSYDFQCLYVMFSDGDLIAITFVDFDALVAVGDLTVDWPIPDLVFPDKVPR